MKKIAILNQDSGYLMIDLANAFDDAGYEVTLITGRLVQRNIPLNKSIRLYRIAEYGKKNIFSRAVTWISAFIQMIYIVWVRAKGAHLLIVTNPPISPFIPFFVRNSYSLLFYDIYIETLGEFLPLRSKSIISRIWVSLHKKSLNNATSIFTLTEGMKANLENFVSNKTISVVPIWTDDDGFLKPIPKKENSFIRANNLDDKFIVMYSGNLGLNNGLKILLDVAGKIKNPKVCFLIVGEGIGKSELVKQATKQSLTNVQFMNWQPTTMLPYSLAAADIAIVTLPLSSGNNAIPSKFFNYLAVGSPILSIAPAHSDLAKLIDKNGVGQNFHNDNVDEIVAFIERFIGDENKRATYKTNSLKVAKMFNKEKAKIIVDKINQVNN